MREVIFTRHDEISVRVLLSEVREDLGIGATIVAEPVVIVDPFIAEHLHLVLHLLRHRRDLGQCRFGGRGHG